MYNEMYKNSVQTIMFSLSISDLISDNFTFASDPMSRRVVQVDLRTGSIAGTAIGEGTLVSNVVVAGQKAYWADQNRRVIKRSNLDGSEAVSIHNAGRSPRLIRCYLIKNPKVSLLQNFVSYISGNFFVKNIVSVIVQ